VAVRGGLDLIVVTAVVVGAAEDVGVAVAELDGDGRVGHVDGQGLSGKDSSAPDAGWSSTQRRFLLGTLLT
jgi:hypothetical protein